MRPTASTMRQHRRPGTPRHGARACESQPMARRTNSAPVMPTFSLLNPLGERSVLSAFNPSPLKKRRVSYEPEVPLSPMEMTGVELSVDVAEAEKAPLPLPLASESPPKHGEMFTPSDWIALKASFAQALQSRDGACARPCFLLAVSLATPIDPHAHTPLPLLHNVLAVCSRVWTTTPDPSSLFLSSPERRPISLQLPPSLSRRSSFVPPPDQDVEHSSKPAPLADHNARIDRESPAAFHNLFGRAMYLYGANISVASAQYTPPPSLNAEVCYRAALDIFAAGERLCSRYLTSPSSAFDWLSALARGRTLARLAIHFATTDISTTSSLSPTLPQVITAFLPPIPSHYALATTTPPPHRLPPPYKLVILAIDHLATVVLHIPRSSPSRDRALWEVGTDSIALAELNLPHLDNFEHTSEEVRARRLRGADSIFELLEHALGAEPGKKGKHEPTLPDVLGARGRCHLLLGRVYLPTKPNAAMQVLGKAVVFFERAEDGQRDVRERTMMKDLEETRRLLASLTVADTSAGDMGMRERRR
jgi:hypothetical protein